MIEFHFCDDDLTLPQATPTPEPSPLPLPTISPSASPTPLGPLPDPSTVHCGDLAGTAEAEHDFSLGGFAMSLGDSGSGSFGLDAEHDYWCDGSLALSGGNPEAPSSLGFEDHDPDPDHPEEGSLSVSGDLTIGASLYNCGRLLAGNDVHLSPRDVAIEQLEEGNDIAIFAGHDVLIAPMFRADEAFQGNTNRVFVFRGIVYAEHDFSFQSALVANSEDPRDDYNRRLYLEGAVVARQGEVLIRGNEKVQIKYNREFLDDLLEKSAESDLIQLEELSMRSI
jgi:hypothetical protein